MNAETYAIPCKKCGYPCPVDHECRKCGTVNHDESRPIVHVMKHKPFTRLELQLLRDKCFNLSDNGINHIWADAYRTLALAADRLDAMVARTEIQGEKK